MFGVSGTWVCPMNQESVVHSRGGTFAEQRSEIPGLRSENPSAGVPMRCKVGLELLGLGICFLWMILDLFQAWLNHFHP